MIEIEANKPVFKLIGNLEAKSGDHAASSSIMRDCVHPGEASAADYNRSSSRWRGSSDNDDEHAQGRAPSIAQQSPTQYAHSCAG